MTHSNPPTDRYCRNFSVIRKAMFIALALLPVGCNKDDQQTSKAPPAQLSSAQSMQPTSAPSESAPIQPTPVAAAKPLTDLESLIAPIALYPDPLLAELLVASTYPLEVVQASRWLETKPDPEALRGKDWDASIMRLASVPQVIKMMNDHLDWTTQLGDAFLAKPVEVMDAIQKLRKRATDSGFLKDTQEQKVTAKTVSVDQSAEGTWVTDDTNAQSSGTTIKATPAVMNKEVIYIQPAKADTVYVPRYNPETVYQASLAPPATGISNAYPATTVVNVNQTAAPAPVGYYPATTTTADPMLTFGAGAVVGGLLTWGIMSWANHNDDDYYHVSHYYGNTVCHNGNCWHGGGGGYYGGGGGGNINTNISRNTNISGNEINIDRGGTFNQNNLKSAQRPASWQPDQSHRRGQAYPEGVQQQFGRTRQPGLAGQRPGSAQTLPASARGFADAGQQLSAETLSAERRPSSADIREQLAQKSGAQDKFANKLQPKPATRDVQERLGQGSRDNALQGIKDSGQAMRFQGQRDSNSRNYAQPANRDSQARQPAGAERAQRQQTEKLMQPAAERKPQITQRQAQMPVQGERSQALAGREQTQLQRETQRRSEAARPNAFEGSRNTSATQMASQRGAISQQHLANAGNQPAIGGGRSSGGGQVGGGGGRLGGGGMRGVGGGGRR
ncbi:MAG: DUF3300 domain-containing protein [Methylococcaceae bacterium]